MLSLLVVFGFMLVVFIGVVLAQHPLIKPLVSYALVLWFVSGLIVGISTCSVLPPDDDPPTQCYPQGGVC